MPWSRRARLSSCHLLFGLIPPEGSFGDDAEAGHIIYNRTLLDFDAVGGAGDRHRDRQEAGQAAAGGAARCRRRSPAADRMSGTESTLAMA